EESAAPASADVPATAQKAPPAAKAAAPAAKGGDKKKYPTAAASARTMRPAGGNTGGPFSCGTRPDAVRDIW
ncbi:MAG: acetyl-CoA carboxylase biotin carboxyl carrier protein subunit, partial [Betaproteobacteria bacterium]